MVLRRSTTLWTWLRAFRKAPRSTVIFMGLRSVPVAFSIVAPAAAGNAVAGPEIP